MPIEIDRPAHQAVRDGLAGLEALVEAIGRDGCDEASRDRAAELMRYFDVSAAGHRRDEERNLFPRLRALALAERQTGMLAALRQLEVEHAAMCEKYAQVREQLEAIVERRSDRLDIERVGSLAYACRRHLSGEEAAVSLFTRAA